MPFITQGRTNWKFLLIVIILAVIVGGGALWYVNRPEKPYQPVGGKDETAKWEIYRNEDYGFEIKYPKDWTSSATVASFIFSSEKIIKGSDKFSCSLNVTLAAKGTNNQYINSLSEERWQKSDTDINGEPAIKLVSVNSPIIAYYFLENSGDYSFQIYHNTTRYTINQDGEEVASGYIYNQECMDIFNLMLSTSKFID